MNNENRSCLRCLNLSRLLLGIACILMQPYAVAKGGSIPAVNLIAPAEVRAVLKEYFVLPDALLKSDGERALFMRRAQREIPDLLQTEGYFSSSVKLLAVARSGAIDVKVEPGPRTEVAQVDIEFQGELGLTGAEQSERVQQLREQWLLQVGSPFNAKAWDLAKADLLARVLRKDYAAAQLVESSAKVDPATASARIHIVVDSGRSYLFGEMQVSGLERYPESMVTRYAGFKHGQAYDRDQLLKLQKFLQNLPQFSSVIVSLDTSHQPGKENMSGPLTAPVKVQIVEAESRKISLGIGYSTNNGVRNEINYHSHNFLDRAWSLNSALVVETNRQTFSTGIDTLPNPQGFQLMWNLSGERTQIEGLETRRDKFGVTRRRTIYGINNDIGLNWQQEQRIPEGGIRENNQALVLDWHWYLRDVNDPMYPMSGTLNEAKLGIAGKAFLSDQDFVRSYARHQSWILISAKDVLLLRIEAGYTGAGTRLGIPQEYLFRVGGTQTVRGFAYQSLGFIEGGAVVGGRVMTTGSAELTHWFNDWGAAMFYDLGGAADVATSLRFSHGYGFGPRWRSPVGPLALDIARGRGEVKPMIHFAIAVAF